MKKSNYNIIVRGKNASFVFNSFTNMYVALSNNVCNDFKSMPVEKFETHYKNIFDTLVKSGIFIPDDRDELSIIRYKNKKASFGSRDLRIVIYPTQDCNLKCWYCYEHHIPNTRMSFEVANRIVAFVEKSIKDNVFDELFVTIFGGEPLLDFDKISFPLISKMKGLVENAGKRFSSIFITNASLITEDVIMKLKSIKPHFQITLDGDNIHHDKVRIWKNSNKPTFEHIIWAIHRLTEEIDGDIFFLTLRINYDSDTLPGIPKILDKIKDIDRKKVIVHFERIWQTEKYSTEKDKTLLMSIFEMFIKEGFCINQGSFSGYPYSCPADTTNSIVVNYDGSIHKCNGRTLSDITKYGKIKEDGTLELDETMMAKRLAVATFENENCLKCKLLPICMGPCSQKLLEHNGVWTKDICSLRSIDTSLDDYLSVEFVVKSMIEKYNE